MKLLKNIIIGIVVLAVVLVLGKNVIAKIAIEKGVTVATGLPLKVDRFDVGLRSTLINIEGFELSNPKGFSDPVMANIPKIFVNYNLGDIIAGNIHMEEIALHLEEFVVVKNENGELNLDSLKPVQKEGADKEAPQKEEKPKEAKPAPEIQIDVLDLKIGKVVYKDYSGGGEPNVKEFKVNINERFENITKVESIVKIIIVKAMSNATLASLTDFDLGGLTSSVSDTLASSTKLAEQLAGETLGAAKGQAEAALKDVKKEMTKVTSKVAADKLAGDVSKEAGKLLGGAGDTAGEATAAVGDAAKKLTGGLFGKIKETAEAVKS